MGVASFQLHLKNPRNFLSIPKMSGNKTKVCRGSFFTTRLLYFPTFFIVLCVCVRNPAGVG